MPGIDMRLRAAALYAVAVLVWLLGQAVPAAAFPLLDPSNENSLPGAATDLAAPDAVDLQHQLQLANGFGAPAGGGWTILPRISFEEVLNDNERQVTKPRQGDLMTLVSPGVSVIGDLPRLQAKLDFAPAVEINVPDGPQNALIQQLNGTGLLTVVPDLAFVDFRAMAGAQALNGLVGSSGAAGNVGEIGSGSGLSTGSSTVGLPKQDRTQTSTFAVAPYLMSSFGDWGTGKLGVSATASSTDQTTGFAAAPFPTGGTNGTSLLTTEQTGQYTTGDFLSEWQDTLSFDLTQTQSSTNQLVSATGDVAAIPRTNITSSRQIISDKLNYAVTHQLTVFATFGHENISYSNSGSNSIDDFTWSGGATWNPNPDSQITVSYGHQNGRNSIQASGRYALTARTVIIGSYTESLGTQLEEVGQQVQQGVLGPDGQFIDGTNGAPLLESVYEAESLPRVSLYRTFNLNVQTVLDRDTFGLNATISKQSSATSQAQSSSNVDSATAQWKHAFSPDLSLSSYAGYTQQTQSAGELCSDLVITACTNSTGGTTRSLVFGATLNYILSETVTANLRYVFTDRTSSLANESMYQDLLIVGITKQF